MSNKNGRRVRPVDLSEAGKHFERLVREVQHPGVRVVVHEGERPTAAIVSAEDLERLERLDEQRESGFQTMERISRSFEDVPLDELEQRVAEAVERARVALRTDAQSPTPPA
jgi:prevent-host-death family protein